MGVSWSEFWSMTPRILKAISEGYSIKIKEEYERQNMIAHLQGRYFADAIMSTVGNALSKSKHSYPKKPYSILDEKYSENSNSNEEIAVFEMKQRTNALKNMGLKESPM